jgi:hypothetical protein
MKYIKEEIDNFNSELNPDGRYHTSPNKIDSVFDKSQIITYERTMKPSGFWYAIGTKWINITQRHRPNDAKYIYEVFPNNKVFSIKNNEDFIEFTKKYHQGFDTSRKIKPISPGIDWIKVTQDYAGIEIVNYIELFNKYAMNNALDNYYSWLYFWDIPSGCIWNKSGIDKLKLVN